MRKQAEKDRLTVLYERLSHDDERAGETIASIAKALRSEKIPIPSEHWKRTSDLSGRQNTPTPTHGQRPLSATY